MKQLAMAVLALAFALTLAPERAAAQEACEYYRVKKGDSLREIAQAAYGDKEFRRIYRANEAEIGRNPNVISVGIVLRLPCLDGTFPDANKTAEVTASEDEGVISFVTANGYLPYTDESLGNRGLFTHLVATAMTRANPDLPVEITFINDWAAHLESLLPRQAFDASFPWTQPGCETQGSLTTVELYACQNFVYSDPFYEVVDGFFSRADSPLSQVVEARGLEGTTVCRPEGYPTSHMDQLGLMPPAVTMVQPTSAYACFEQLMAGKVDLVALDTRAAERVVMDMGLDNQVSENPYLYGIEPLRVALHKSNPKSAEIVEALNIGLGIMLQSGEWAAIVSEGLKEQPTALVN